MSVEVIEPWNPLPWFSLLGVLLILLSLVVLPKSPRRPGVSPQVDYYYGLFVGLGVSGLLIASLAGQLHYLLAFGYELFAIGVLYLLRFYGGERALNAAWLWLVASQTAFVFLMLNISLGGSSNGWWIASFILLLVLPLWPLSFWWQGTLSQSPLPVLPLFAFSPVFFLPLLPQVPESLHPWLAGLALFSILLATLSVGRQSDLKLSAALVLWIWLLILYLQISYTHWLLHPGWIEISNLVRPVATYVTIHDTAYITFNTILFSGQLLSLALVFSALALLLGHLQKVTGSTYIEDFHPLAANPRLHRFRRCWTLASWLLAGLPLSLLWTDLAKWVSSGVSRGDLSLWWIGFLLLAMVFLAGSLFHLRARLFYGDAHTNGKLVVRDLGTGTYSLIIALLGLAFLLPWLKP